MTKTFRLDEFGYEVEIGKVAAQADGAVWFKQGGTVVVSTVVSAPSKEFPGFLPLTVDYRELFSAAGKIPGGYFKREGKFTDKEILTSRIIDRAIRPLFPAFYFNQIQILATVYSVDKEHVPGPLALLATSIALTISKIPFIEPVGIVEVARERGVWIFNPTYSQMLNADVRLTIAGTKDGICMVEGSSQEISEEHFIDVMFQAHEKIKQQVAWQEEIRAAVGIEKEVIDDGIDWNGLTEQAQKFLTLDRVKGGFIDDKLKRGAYLDQVREEFLVHFKDKIEAEELHKSVLTYIFDTVLQKKLSDAILTVGHRIDGRSFETVRSISNEVGLLPCVHGSALFTRGRTQALVSVTLGGGQDEQRVEELMGESVDKNFMLHYNFPPFSVGEVRAMRGPGRREVGHGYLAASAIKQVLPDAEKFAYTIRIVADMLEADGSTSMATVCGSTMALMNAGVPIRKMISGVAMGLLQGTDGKFQPLTDIAGIEDAFGLMDFKVTGTDDGITAIQMDIKHKGGLSREVFKAALAQAKRGRAHILAEMRKVMSNPNPTLSELVPHIVSFKVPTDKIGAIIGTGGKVIREIIDKTGTSIDIEDDGVVKVFGHPGPKLQQAVNWVKTLGGLIERGSHYQGKIKRFADFGVFVELVPGLDGLVHISNIPKAKQRNFMQDYPLDSTVTVEVLDYDEATGRIRLKLIDDHEKHNQSERAQA
jgi:polyribonucleotide nucleotidyltransferase